MNRCAVFGMLLCAVLIAGCGSSSTDEGSGVELVAPTDNGAANTAKKVATANKAYQAPVQATLPDPEPILTMINAGAGVLNPDFSEQVDQVPDYWEVSGGVRVLTGGYDNSPAVACINNDYVRLTQELPFDASPAGKTITLTVQAMTAIPDSTTAVIVLENGTKQASEPHPGDSKWRKLSVSMQVPEDYDSNLVTISLQFNGKAPANDPFRAWFDDVNVTMD